jgi:hypothetical protein
VANAALCCGVSTAEQQIAWIVTPSSRRFVRKKDVIVIHVLNASKFGLAIDVMRVSASIVLLQMRFSVVKCIAAPSAFVIVETWILLVM